MQATTIAVPNISSGIHRLQVRARDADFNVDQTPAVLEFHANAQAAQRFLANGETEEVDNILVDIVADNRRAAEIIRRIRSLLQKHVVERELLDINDVTEEIADLLWSEAVINHVDVQLGLGGELPYVQIDRVQIQQVILNLALNGIESMRNCDHERKLVIETVRDGNDRVRIAVRDLGIGLGDADIEQLFQPFHTTKADGMGMGLAISRTIVEAHGGDIWAENNAADGATFYVSLPIAADTE